jgi:PKD repeat protein
VCELATITYSTPFNAGSTYQWVVSGQLSNTSPTSSSITITWDASAYGSIIVYETNAFGCIDSATLCVEKVDLPVASFTHPSSVCKLVTVYFNNTSTGATSHYWTFGDGGTSSLVNPSHTYANAGTYTITLIVSNDCHCSDTFQSVITVDSLQGPDISCPSTVCPDVTATYSTSVSGCTYSWIVIGGTIIGPSNQQTVNVLWGLGPMGMLGLVVSGCGAVCSDTTWVQVPIIAPVGIISGPSKVCPGECHTFSLPLYSGTTYTWSLNNSSCGYIPDSACCEEVEVCWPPYVYPCTDTLTVSYYNSILGCGGTASHIIRVRPELAVYGPPQACANGVSGFAASGGIPCNWTVSPSGPIISGSPSPFINIDWQGLTGTFRVTAIPLNPNQSCNDSAFTIITVVAPPSAPVITGSSVVCGGSTVQYCASGSGNIQWMITGGTPAATAGNCVAVSWGNTPPFIVRAYEQSVAFPYCNSDTTVINVGLVSSSGPPSVSGSLTACANGSSAFTCTTAYPPGAEYQWSILPGSAGSIVSGQGSNAISVEWGNNAPQTITLKLKVKVCSGTDSTQVTVALQPAPVPVVSLAAPLCQGGTSQLVVTGGAFSAYTWSGPGGYSSAVNPTTISLEGLYQVTVTDAGGCQAKTQITVDYSGNPVASISALGPLQHCIGSSYAVSLCALGNPAYLYQWSNLATSQCITVNSPGAYVVTVTDNANGCTSVSNVLVVAEDSCIGGPGGGTCLPAGSIGFTHSSCNPKVFTNTSVNASSFTWNFGDFTYSNLQNPTHTYNQAGFFLVTLSGYVGDASGTDSCLLQDTALIEIPLLPRFGFVTGCDNDPVCFTDQSVFTAGNNITSWQWNFGDANTSNLQNPCHTYASAGTYIVTLTIANPSCTTSWNDTVVIAPPPIAAFNAGSACTGVSVAFTDNSSATVDSWNWSFGNGGTSLNQNPSSTYPLPGSYPVTLIATDSFGCSDTVTQAILVNSPQASGPITALPDTIVCAGTPVSLIAPAFPGATYLWSTGSCNDTIVVWNTGNYSVSVSDPNGCIYDTDIGILVNAPPSAQITGNGNHLCLGSSMSLITPYNANWEYEWISNDTTINGTQLSSVFFFPQNAGTYTFSVVITDTLTGCSDTTLPYAVTVTIPPAPPLITALTSTTICTGDTIMLLGSHPDTSLVFEWSTGDWTDTLFVMETGCYSLSVTDTNGCTAFAMQCVTVNPLPELCAFLTGCLDTCGPFLLLGPAGNASYQWLLNGLPLPGDTLQNLLATLSGQYSLIVTSPLGCTDTTDVLNLSLHPCPLGPCASLLADSLGCDSAGAYVLHFRIINQGQDSIGNVDLNAVQPGPPVLFSPLSFALPLGPGDTSAALTTTLTGLSPGDTVCISSLLCLIDPVNNDSVCCSSDTVCLIIPPCPVDTSCCFLDIVAQTISCPQDPTSPAFAFVFEIQGCGTLNVQSIGNGTLGINTPLVLTGGFQGIFGSWIPSNLQDTTLCLHFLVNDGADTCVDTILCFTLPVCQVDTPGCCSLNVTMDTVNCFPGQGGVLYEFSLLADGCGALSIGSESNGNLLLGGPYPLNGTPTLINGAWIPASPQDTLLCLNFSLSDTSGPCLDTIICFILSPCINPPIPNTGACCLRNGTCIVTTQQSCRQQCGYWQGLGSTCYDRPCPRLDTLSGTVVYANTARSALANVWITLEDTLRRPCREVVLTGPTGTFSFEVWPGVYELTASTERPWHLGAANSLDALVIARHYVRLDTLEEERLQAADVDRSSVVNTTDALQVMRRFVGQIPTFAAGDWLFPSQLITVDSGYSGTPEIAAILTGDANASYIPSKNSGIGIQTEGTLKFSEGGKVVIPIGIDHTVLLAALSLELFYPPLLQFSDIRMPDAGGHLEWKAEDGILRLAWFSLDEKVWEPGQDMIELECVAEPGIDPENLLFLAGHHSEASDLSGKRKSFNLLLPELELRNDGLELLPPLPNPSAGPVAVRFRLPSEGHTRLEIFNAFGENVAVLTDKTMSAGLHQLDFHCKGCPGGMYHLRLTFEEEGRAKSRSQRLLRIR